MNFLEKLRCIIVDSGSDDHTDSISDAGVGIGAAVAALLMI